MKYDRLYNFISPVTGKLASYGQFPDLKSDYIIIGDRERRPQASPALIDVRLDNIKTRHDLDTLLNTPFIIQLPNINLPKAQALSNLENGVMGNNNGVVEILQRVSGPDISTDNAIARFNGTTGQFIKDSKVTIDNSGELYANSLHVKNSTGFNTGFNASSLMLGNVLYSLPTSAGFPTQMLTTPGIPGLTGSYQLYWSTPPGQITINNPAEPGKPYPVYTPVPLVVPVGVPYSVPVFVPVEGSPAGQVTTTHVSIDPEKGDINTPGNVNANNIHGNNAEFDGDLDIDGDLSTEGSIHSEGNVSGDAFDFEDISELSDDFVRMEAPYDLDHSYQIELADAEPIMQEQVQPPDQRILQTARRRMIPQAELLKKKEGYRLKLEARRATKRKNGIELTKADFHNIYDEDLPITKMMWTELDAEYPLKIELIPATTTTNEKFKITYEGSGGGTDIDISYAADLVYGTLNNVGGYFEGYAISDKDSLIRYKTSYQPTNNDLSSVGIGLFNRRDNGYILKNSTDSLNNTIFNLQQRTNGVVTDLLSYNSVLSVFNLLKPIEVLPPILPKNPATKEYVDSRPVGGGTVTQINTGLGLTGGPITNNGTISLSNTGIASGDYRFANFTVNPQGQLTLASNGSPVATTLRTIAVWGNNSGTSLLNTNVTINTLGDVTSNGASTFATQQISNADAIGSLNFQSGSFSLQLRLANSMSSNTLWFLPVNNSSGVFRNNGFGTLSWGNVNSSEITFNANMNANNKVITNLSDPVNLQDAVNKRFLLANTGNITGNLVLSNSGSISGVGIVLPYRLDSSVPLVEDAGYLYAGFDKKLYYSNSRGTVLIGGA